MYVFDSRPSTRVRSVFPLHKLSFFLFLIFSFPLFFPCHSRIYAPPHARPIRHRVLLFLFFSLSISQPCVRGRTAVRDATEFFFLFFFSFFFISQPCIRGRTRACATLT